MSETIKNSGQGSVMNIPKSILFTTIKGAITSGQDDKIQDLTDLLYGSLENSVSLSGTIALQSNRLDQQHQEIMSLVETVKDGFGRMDKRFEELRQDMNNRFEQVDKRFEDLIGQMDKRFEQVDKRFEEVDRRFTMMMWAIGIGFTAVLAFIGSLTMLLK